MTVKEFLTELKRQSPLGRLDLEMLMPDGLPITHVFVSMNTVILSDTEEEVTDCDVQGHCDCPRETE